MPATKPIDSRAVVNRRDIPGLIVDSTQLVETLDRLGDILATARCCGPLVRHPVYPVLFDHRDPAFVLRTMATALANEGFIVVTEVNRRRSLREALSGETVRTVFDGEAS